MCSSPSNGKVGANTKFPCIYYVLCHLFTRILKNGITRTLSFYTYNVQVIVFFALFTLQFPVSKSTHILLLSVVFSEKNMLTSGGNTLYFFVSHM